MILAALVSLDLIVAGLLATVAPSTLVELFEYGRSVPGKIAVWEKTDRPGDLLEVAWRPDIIAISETAFTQEETDRPVVRGYGMSFVNNILRSASERDPNLALDLHSGPAAPPNFTYAVFLEDRHNRRAGDIAVLGILSGSVANMFSLSNRSWSFEQPAPFTYPVFRSDGPHGLSEMSPLIDSLSQELDLNNDPDLARRWHNQLASDDAINPPSARALPLLDASPFIRLLRRARATDDIADRQAAILEEPWDGDTPYGTVLSQMVQRFAEIARQDSQIPIVFLVQGRDRGDPNLLVLLGDTLRANAIPFLATANHQDPRDVSAFLPDGHYRPRVDAVFGEAFLDLIGNL